MRIPWLHPHQTHRARQLRWIVPVGLLLVGGTIATLAVQYWLSDQAVGDQFFRAHKTIAHTGELLVREYLVGGAVLLALFAATGAWALHVSHRIVRPVHALHLTLDELVAGRLGVRVVLHERDEFREVGDALNRFADEVTAMVQRVHEVGDRLETMAAGDTAGELRAVHDALEAAVGPFALDRRHFVREGQA